MTAFFITILNISISASWMIGAVWLVRLLLKRAPRWITCLLWGFVALRLLLPFSIPSPVSLLPSGETIPQTVLTEDTPSIHSGIPVVDDAVNPLLENTAPAPVPDTAPTPQPQENALASALDVGVWVWIVGMIGILLAAEISYIALRWRLSDAEIISDRIRRSNRIDSPFLFGILHPQIYLPVTLTDGQREYVLAHEQRHLRRLDHLTKLFAYVLLAVYWFNPLVWLAYILFCRDLETACDEGVVKNYDIDRRKAYATALLDCCTMPRFASVCPVAFGEVNIKSRIKKVLTYRKPIATAVLFAVVLCIIIGVCFLTTPLGTKAEGQNEPSPEDTTTLSSATTTTTTSSSTTTTTTSTTTTTAPPTYSLYVAYEPYGTHNLIQGQSVSFDTEAGGGIAPYTYQWQRKNEGSWLDIAESEQARGTQTAKLTLVTGNYSGELNWINSAIVRCRITDANGDVVYTCETSLTVMNFDITMGNGHTRDLLSDVTASRAPYPTFPVIVWDPAVTYP